jgi:hypothetical protein
MAHLRKRISPNTGRVTWLVQFRKRVYGKNREVKKDLSYNAMFPTKEEAEKFIDEYEHIFFLKDAGDNDYDRLMEKRRRRFRHKIKENE